MPGGLLQIASSGIQDVYLTKNPEITFFKKIYRRHTNFSLETIEINIDQTINYGDNFFITIPKFGDLLYRTHFKVELPKLNFDDSYITDSKYLTIKNNNIKFLEDKMNMWKTEYDSLVSFSEIQIIFYQKILLLLTSQDVTYQNINNQVLTLRNSYNNQLKNTVFKIDEDIYDKIDIINYIIDFDRTFGSIDDKSNNIITYETFLKKITTLYNNNIKQLEYYYSNYIYYKKKLSTANSGNIQYSWINNLGHHYFSNYNIEIDGQVIESYSNDYLNIYNLHHIKDNELKNYNEMIGNVKEINTLDSIKTKYDMYIPLIFWFNRNANNAIPLVSMKHSELTLNVTVNELYKLIYFYSYKDEYTKLLIFELPFIDHQKIKEYPKSLWDINPNVAKDDILEVKYIERERIYIYYFKHITKELLKLKFENISESEIDIFFAKYSSDSVTISYNDWINFRINSKDETDTNIINICQNINLYNSPHFEDINSLIGKISRPNIKFYAEYIYLDEIERFKFAKNDLEYVINIPQQINTDVGKIEYFSTDIDLLKPSKDFFWFLIPKTNINGLTKYSFKDPNIVNKSFYIDDNIVSNIKFSIQDMNLIDFKYGENFYIYGTKYEKLNSSNSKTYYYSFSLYPEEEQPSGAANFSKIKGKNIQIYLNKNFITKYYNVNINKNLQNLELIFINRSYNILKFEKGKSTMIFY